MEWIQASKQFQLWSDLLWTYISALLEEYDCAVINHCIHYDNYYITSALL